MEKLKWFFLVIGILALSMVLSGCVNMPPKPASNAYLGGGNRYDEIEITVAPVFLNFQNTTPSKRESTVSGLLNASLPCVEDAKYVVSKSGEETEFNMVFSNAWEGDPNHEGDLVGDFLHFTIKKNSQVYIYDSDLKLIDGPDGNDAGIVTTEFGTFTVERESVYVNDNIGGTSYSKLLKVSLSFPIYDIDGLDYSLEVNYYFAKNVGLVKFTMMMTYDGQEFTVFKMEVVKTYIDKYNIGPLPATSLSEMPLGSTSVAMQWQKSDSAVSYDVYLLDQNGNLIDTKHTSSTTAVFDILRSGVYMWAVRSVDQNGLSTFSKLKIFTFY